ncbi:hypothetical protein EDF62_0055 [Leucobacter luti]|uniref:Uncharacterized protein n=1 Tax=Leucobacter luti TaxID=340320 RepID=A0A4R6S6D9_9MICO|nr:hypothetical protein EDF62_0055 [Leucobacter luti]
MFNGLNPFLGFLLVYSPLITLIVTSVLLVLIIRTQMQIRNELKRIRSNPTAVDTSDEGALPQ